MNHLRPRSKILLLIMIILASCVALVAARETRATWQTNPEGSVHLEDDVFPVNTRLPGPAGVDGFAQIKATAFPVDTRLPGPSGADELKKIKVNGDLMP